MDGKIKKINLFSTIPDKYVDSLLKDNFIKNYYNQEWEIGTFITRLTDALQEKDNANRGRRDRSTVVVNKRDLEEILRQFDSMDNRLRNIYIDADLRSEPTIINMPDSIEKEEFIKNNPQALF